MMTMKSLVGKMTNKYVITSENDFKFKYSYEERKKEATTIKERYPDRIPVIVEKEQHSDIVEIDKHKFLVPNHLTVGQFVYVIRKRMKLPPEKAIFIFVHDQIPNHACLMKSIYEESKDSDEFLYIKYTGENAFG